MCPTTKKIHLQMYCVATKTVSGLTVKKFFDAMSLYAPPHLEKRRGSHQKAIGLNFFFFFLPRHHFFIFRILF